MPVIEIRGLAPDPGIDIPAALKRICAEVARAMGCEDGQVWATWQTVEHYVEGPTEAQRQPVGTHPPIATLTAFEGRAEERVSAGMNALAQAISREFKTGDGNVFAIYLETRSGRVFTGGKLR